MSSLNDLLTSLEQARQGSALILDNSTLGATSTKALLELFSEQLQIASFTLNEVQLPPEVTGDTLAISGAEQGVSLVLSFQDVQDAQGVLAIRALFQAPTLTPLQALFTKLPAGFFKEIVVDGAGASVAVPGLATLHFASPSYGVVGIVTPSSGLVTEWIAPRVDGQVSPPSGAKGLFVELQTATSGCRIAPLTDGWSFDDLGWLMPKLGILGAFPDIIPTKGLGLKSFDLNLYPQAPSLSSLSLDVADIKNPTKPLWSAAGGKVELTDVNVTLALTYPASAELALAGSGSVQGNFKFGRPGNQFVLQAQIPFPLSGVWSLTAFPNLSLEEGLEDLATLLDSGASFSGVMPAGLSDVLDQVELTYLRIAVSAEPFNLVEFTFALGLRKPWPLIPNVLVLEKLNLHMTSDGKSGIYGSVVGDLELPNASEILVSFGRSTPNDQWRLDVISPAIALPSLTDLAQIQGAPKVDLGSLVKAGGLDQGGSGGLHFLITGLNFGLAFGPTKLMNLGLTLQLANASAPLSPQLDWELIPGLTLTEFSFGFQLDWGGTDTKKAFGTFVLNGLEFDIRFAEESKQGAKTDALIAEYYAQGDAGKVDVKHLIHSISPSVAEDVPEGLEIDLNDAILVYFNNAGTKKYLFAMDIAVEFPLSDLPLIGNSLPADAKAGIKNLKVVVASAALTADEVSFVNGLSPHPVLPLPAANTSGDAIPKGFSMVAELELGAASILMTSPPAKQQGTTTPPQLTAGAGTAPPAAAASDSVMWINVQKTFGPVAIQKVGFSYQDGGLFVLSNMSLAAGGLEIDLLGIGIGSPIKNPLPKFTIQGLAVSYVEGPVSVMGGMLGTLDPTIDFTGALSVRAPELTLAALAGYAEYEGHPSFFLYGVLDVPLGGPPAFFITGVAAGIGFNRKLIVPDVSGVAAFPLVAWAMGSGPPPMDPSKPIGDQVATALTQLAQKGVVAPSVGDYWFAAGIRFTSFELVDSFALITLCVGTDVEIALLGLSTLKVPPGVDEPVAEVQLAMEVSFSSGSGLLAIAAQLTNNSYVLSRSCRLTGGFAFYLWFKDDLGGGHPYAGETVLSLGGYNPHFDVPQYYPVVPRLGIEWQVSTLLKITGELYFAVTSNAIMAGGKLSAVWSSGPIRAWFMVWADFLIVFEPFHYYIDGGIDLGASLTIDLGLFSLSLTIDLGVDLALWGPPFAGRAIVNLWIISFTISFGDTIPSTKIAISWNDFVMRLLTPPPAPKSGQAVRRGRPLMLADSTAAPQPAPVLHINVTSGLVRALASTGDDGPVYLVNAETFQCALLTLIPNKVVTFDPDPKTHKTNIAWAPDAQQPADKNGNPIEPNNDFGVGPVNLLPDQFQPKLELSLASPEDSVLQAIRRLTNAPKALWENKTFDAHGVPQVDPKTGLKESTIPHALIGLTLIPCVAPPDHTLPIPLDSLLFTLSGPIRPFAWSPGMAPTADWFTHQTVADTIAAPEVASVRGALLCALEAQGVCVNTAVNVAGLTNPANNDLQADPRLRLLGEQTPAVTATTEPLT